MTAQLETHEIRTLLAELVEPAVIDAVLDDRVAYAQTPVVELGIDSLAVMELVARIEQLARHDIDWDTFELREVATLDAIDDLVCRLREQR